MLEETISNSSVVLPQRKIEQLHEAVVNGDLKSVQSHLTRRKLALSKDENGHGLLHKVVYFGHRDIYDWLANTYPETLETRDWVRKGHKHERDTHNYNHLISGWTNSPPLCSSQRPIYDNVFTHDWSWH